VSGLSRPSVALFALVLVLGLFARAVPLVLLALAVLLVVGLAHLWRRHGLTGLEYRRQFGRRGLEHGQSTHYEIEIVNRKLLPLLWLEIEEEVPRALAPEWGQHQPAAHPERVRVRLRLALWPYERVRRRTRITGVARGEHAFGPVRLRVSDPFGLLVQEAVIDAIETLVVYPRVLPVTVSGLPARQPLGTRAVRRWLFEDPTRVGGVREYRPGDDQRRLHWAATARTQRLQAKVYEPTTDQQVMIFLDVQTVPGPWWGLQYDPEALELAVLTAAALVNWALERRYPVGLATNAFGLPVVPLSRDPGQRWRLLEGLGRLRPLPARPFAETLATGARWLPYGTTLVAVSTVAASETLAVLSALRRRGHPVVLVTTGQAPVPPPAGIPTGWVGPPERWPTLTMLTIDLGPGAVWPAGG